MQKRKAIVFIGPKDGPSREYSQHLRVKLRAGNPLVIKMSEVLKALQDRRVTHQIKTTRLVADSVVIKALGRHIKEHAQKAKILILDGFPQTQAQANFLSERGPALWGIDSIVVLEVVRNLGDISSRGCPLPVIHWLTLAGAEHLRVETVGNVESTNRAIAESVLSLLQVRTPHYNPNIPLVPLRASMRTTASV